MKRPKPRDFGLDSDHPSIGYPFPNFPIDPAQPLTQDELDAALESLVRAEATRIRNAKYAEAFDDYAYNAGGR